MPCEMLEVATTLQSRPPRLSEAGTLLLTARSTETNGTATPVPKAAPLPAPTSILFKSLAMASVNFTITTPARLTGVFHPVLGRKTELLLNPFRFGSRSYICQCHGHALSSQCRTDFSHHELTNYRYLVDTEASLRIVPCKLSSSPSGPLLKGADGQPILSGGFIKKNILFQSKLFISSFLQAAVA
jgi:hypothetical protein